jgi:hypothetical protein
MLQVVRGTAARGERYYKPLPAAQPKRITAEGLQLLRAIHAAGSTAELILAFGPHAGETLAQVAMADPDYLRKLATTAQRPDVRAAAARMIGALSAPTQAARFKRGARGRGKAS